LRSAPSSSCEMARGPSPSRRRPPAGRAATLGFVGGIYSYSQRGMILCDAADEGSGGCGPTTDYRGARGGRHRGGVANPLRASRPRHLLPILGRMPQVCSWFLGCISATQTASYLCTVRLVSFFGAHAKSAVSQCHPGDAGDLLVRRMCRPLGASRPESNDCRGPTCALRLRTCACCGKPSECRAEP